MTSEWMTIESAPKDAEILVYNVMTGPYVTRHQRGEWPLGRWDDKFGRWFPQPTHWMPLPEPPENPGSEP